MIHFYCFTTDKKIIASDLPVEKIRKKFGYRYEILTSIKDKNSVEIAKSRIQRSYPQFIIEELYQKIKPPISLEARKKISDSKLGKPRDAATRAKISRTMKGKSNFQGKRHTEETKRVMAVKKFGNQHVKDLKWVHDPNGDTEKRVKSRLHVPSGYLIGRDYYSVEPGLYSMKNKTKD